MINPADLLDGIVTLRQDYLVRGKEPPDREKLLFVLNLQTMQELMVVFERYDLDPFRKTLYGVRFVTDRDAARPWQIWVAGEVAVR